MYTYKFYWLDGKVDTANGNSVAQAFSSLGYDSDTISDLDYYEIIV